MKVKSLKQESILKQFYLYFLVASIIPLIILVYLLFQFLTTSKIDTASFNFKFLLVIAGIFAALGFFGTRSFVVKIVSLSRRLNTNTPEKISKEAILAFAEGDEEVASLAKVFGEITSKLELNIKELEQTKNTLYRVLSRVGNAISSIENFDRLIQFVLETTIEALGAKRGAIFYLDEETKTLKLKAVDGYDSSRTPTNIKIGEEAVGWVAKERKSLLVPFLEDKESDNIFSPPLIATPLIVHDKVMGVISLSGSKRSGNFTEDELKILSNLAFQIAVSFENAKLNAESEKTYFETIAALALAVEAKDPYSRGHSDRVAKYARIIAEYLGLSQEEINTLKDAARLHDIGKIGITDEILHKPGKLNKEEELIMNKHPQIGEGIVRPLKNFHHIINPIKHHHEFLDGSGYPDGLKGNEIPLVTRILTVADIFDAMTTSRPYRAALNIEGVKRELDVMVQAGKIDRDVVNTLLKLMEEKKIS